MQTRFSFRVCSVLAAVGLVTALGLLSAAERPPRKVAFLVGVSKYDHDFSNLGYAEEDVKALATVLKDDGFELVILLGSADGKDKATRKNIEERLRSLLEGDGDADKKIRKGDVLLLALSGHGQELAVDDKDDPKKKRQDTFFAPADGMKGNPKTLVSLSHLLDDVVPFGATNLLLVDACREKYEPNKGKGINGQHVALQGKTAVLFSCSEGEQSFESAELKHGVFSYAVLQSLSAAAKKNETMSWSTLVADVEKQMESDEFRKLLPEEKTQTPVQASGQVPATQVLAGKRKPALLTAPFSEKEAKAAQEAWAKFLKRKVEEEIDLGGGVKLVMVLIPPGKFQMGSPKDEKGHQDDEELHDVEITKPFYLGKYPVTQEQYEAITGKNPSYFATTGEDKDYRERVQGLNTKRFPVENVSWDMATAWCVEVTKKDAVKRSIRLPREAEWEYACRAGTTTAFFFGAVLNGKQANCEGTNPYGTDEKGPYPRRTTKVGEYGENSWGLCDMHGNVWQWCADYYDEKYYTNSPIKDPFNIKKPTDGRRVQRGGSWNFNPSNCRAAIRYRNAPEVRIHFFGFRVCLSLD